MNRQETLEELRRSLSAFLDGGLEQKAIALFETLGYHSPRRIEGLKLTVDNLGKTFKSTLPLRPDKALASDWQSIHLLFQLTDDEISAAGRERQVRMIFDSASKVDPSIYRSYLFFAVALQDKMYSRSQLAGITREINRLFPIPVMVLFRHGQTVSFAIIHRRPHKRQAEQDVLEKVTLIKDIRLADPHRAHLEILTDLALPELYARNRFTNFLELHQAWQDTLNISELNKRFYKDLANWFFWAIEQVRFPEGAGPDEITRNKESIIRLITRLIFVWFIKEKGLVPDDLFRKDRLDEILIYEDPQNSTYYKAILQNLFFATLNTDMGTERRFITERTFHGANKEHNDVTRYRYKRYFKDPDAALHLFSRIPFLNGGLFECLDL